jgi:hypothetical protein
MDRASLLPLTPIQLPLKTNEIIDVFPVLKERSIGLVHEKTLSLATIAGSDLCVDQMPLKGLRSKNPIGLPQEDIDSLFVKDAKSLLLVDWSKKILVSEFFDNSILMETQIEKSKIIDYHNGIALSLFRYCEKNGDNFHQFAIDTIPYKKRLKKIKIPKSCDRPLTAYFTPSFVFCRSGPTMPWNTWDNDLNMTSHPFADLLNRSAQNREFLSPHCNMLISEKQKHAFIVSHSAETNSDSMFLATWHCDPKILPVAAVERAMRPGDEFGHQKQMKHTKGLRIVPKRNGISPSGKWVFFSIINNGNPPATHYLMRIAPKLPCGYLPPYKLGIEGNVTCMGWMTYPEGLILSMDTQLWYLDLSRFDAGNSADLREAF